MDWYGLARIGAGLARIGKLANLSRNEKLTPDWHRIGTDWHGLDPLCVVTNFVPYHECP